MFGKLFSAIGPNSSLNFRIALFSGVPWSASTAGFLAVGDNSCFKSSRAADSRSAESEFGSLHLVGGKSTRLLSRVPLVPGRNIV